MSEMQLEDVKTIDDLLKFCGMAPGVHNPTPDEARIAAVAISVRAINACLHHCASFLDTEEGLAVLETGPNMSELVAHYGDDESQAAELASLREENARKDAALKELSTLDEEAHRTGQYSLAVERAAASARRALASARPAPAQEQGEEMLRALSFEEAENLSRKCEYAIAAVQPKENPINWADAAAFFLEGYHYARALLARKPAEVTVPPSKRLMRLDLVSTYPNLPVDDPLRRAYESGVQDALTYGHKPVEERGPEVGE